MRSRRIAGVTLILVVMVLVPVLAEANKIRGGQLYDKWWVVNLSPEPTGDHPLYPDIGQKSGSTTYRCKECHGWDYKGADGAYGPGNSHFTGIPGVFGTLLSGSEMFDLIKNPDGVTVNGHDFGNIGLSDADIQDLVEFVVLEVRDTDLFISPSGQFIGDEVAGGVEYDGNALCTLCHGPNGTNINFGTPEDPVWVGTLASENPWEVLHKIRMGQPGTNMPSLIDFGGTDQESADIGLYSQTSLTGGTLIFYDGFESEDFSGWDSVSPPPVP